MGNLTHIKFSDLNNWSVLEIKNRQEKKFMYLKKGGLMVQIAEKPKKRFSFSWFTNHKADQVVWLTKEKANEINSLLKQARTLEGKAKTLRKKANLILCEPKSSKNAK